MEVKAQLKNLRIAPRKVRLVANLIKGMDTTNAVSQLEYSTKKSSENILTLLNSAIANAKNNFKLDEKKLYISEIMVNGGTIMKRSMPRAMGRAFPIKKRTCHVILILKATGSDATQEKNNKEAKEIITDSNESNKRSKPAERKAINSAAANDKSQEVTEKKEDINNIENKSTKESNKTEK